MALRTGIGDWHYLRLNADDLSVEEMSVSHYLAFKEKLAAADDRNGDLPNRDSYDPFIFELDMAPFNAHQPKIKVETSIGQGVEFLNKTLSARMFGPAQSAEGIQSMLTFLNKYKGPDGASLLLSRRMNNVSKLRNALVRAERLLNKHDDDVPIDHVAGLDELGFLPGEFFFRKKIGDK